MTNKIAIALGLFILAIFALDYYVIGADIHIFLGRKLGDLIEYMAFWR
jgi:hypothetical protein